MDASKPESNRPRAAHMKIPARHTRLGDQAQAWMKDARIRRRPLKLIAGYIWDTEHEFTRFDFVMGVISVILYIADVGTDVRLAVMYFVDGEWIYGGLTTALVVIAYLVVMFMGWIYYGENRSVPKAWWCCRIVFLILGLSPVILTVEFLYRGWKSRTCTGEDEKTKYTKTATGNSAVRMLEGFLEAAPQLCFQLYVVFRDKPEEDVPAATLRGFSLLSSWASLAVTALTYYKYMRLEKRKQEKLEISGQICYLLWRVCETGGRVLCIALFASTFEFWVLGVVCLHFALVSTWKFCTTDNQGCPTPFAVLRSCLFGYVMVFYIPFYSNPSRYVFLVYYVIFYGENFLMLGLWAGMTSDRDAWFYIPGIAVVVVFFFLHVAMQLIFYVFFHPSAESIKWCVKCDRESFCVPVCSRQSDVKQMNSADGISEDEKSSLTGHAPLMEVDDCVNKQKMQTVGSLTNGLYGGRCVGEGERCSEGDEGNTSQRILKEYRYDDIPFMDEDL
ncbi:hypothetical protein BaRGS_00002887 [Batillaria attramentaria]|uniref:XK-related protein n=1 Tax=Batillaria attramentaria TaxID=370345 RepID=A0ABD0M1J0_9CAEN